MAKPFDIRKRAELFANHVFQFCPALLAKSTRHERLVDQLNDAAGSIGANLEEAQAAESNKDFIHKNNLALKEARESRYWLRLARSRERSLRPAADPLIDEASELIAIITAIILEAKSNRYRGGAVSTTFTFSFYLPTSSFAYSLFRSPSSFYRLFQRSNLSRELLDIVTGLSEWRSLSQSASPPLDLHEEITCLRFADRT